MEARQSAHVEERLAGGVLGCCRLLAAIPRAALRRVGLATHRLELTPEHLVHDALGGDHLGVTGALHLAVAEDRVAIGMRTHVAEKMRDEHDGEARSLERADALEEAIGVLLAEARGGLVEDQDPCVRAALRERARDLHELLIGDAHRAGARGQRDPTLAGDERQRAPGQS